MITEQVEIRRNSNGVLADVSGSLHIEKLLNEYKKEQMPDADEPFHHEAEIAAGFRFFIEWLKRKEQ